MALGETLSRLRAGCALVLRQRLELAALDVEEELLRLTLLLAGTLATTLLATLALAALAASIAVYYWDTARLAALLGITAAFALATGVAAWRLARFMRAKPPFMSATLAQLGEDARQLGARP